MSKLRVAIVQMDFFPAMIKPSTNFLQEPSGDDSDGLHKLLFLSSIENLCKQFEETYCKKIYKKIRSILDHANQYKVDIIVFPEYSIPPTILPQLDDYSKTHGIIIVAGTHTVNTNSDIYYQKCNIPLSIKCANSDVRKSVCPIIGPKNNYVIKKKRRSKWETDMVVDLEPRTFIIIEANGKCFNLLVLICIEALSINPELKENTLLVVPAWSPTIEPFDDIGQCKLINEVPTLFVNTAKIGSSKICAQFTGENMGMSLDNCTNPLPKGSEVVLIADIDLMGQFKKRNSVIEHVPSSIICYSPLLYIDENKNNKLQGIIEDLNVSEFNLLLEIGDNVWHKKIEYLLNAVKIGTLRLEDAPYILSYIPIDPSLNINDLRKSNLNDSINLVHKIFMDVPSNQHPLVANVLSSLSTNLDKNGRSITNQTQSSSMEMRPFYNRDELFTQINRFFNDPNERVLYIKGMKGIGKTAFINQVFKKVLPESRWSKIEIRLTPGTGIVRFLSQLNYELRTNIDPYEIEKISKAGGTYSEISERLLTIFDTMKDACLVIDEWQFILNQLGDFINEDFKQFFKILIDRSSYKGNKVILVGSRAFFKYEYKIAPSIKLKPLNDENIKTILDYHIRSYRGAQYVYNAAHLVPYLHGLPLAAVLAAQITSKAPVNEMFLNSNIFQKFSHSLVDYLLEGINLSDNERFIVKILSVVNIPVNMDFINNFFNPVQIDCLFQLIDKFIIDINDNDHYELHPLLKKYFYDCMLNDEQIQFHTLVGAYYENLCESGQDIPENIGETVYHLASSMDLNKALKFKESYSSELGPVALKLYSSRNYLEAVRYYEALSKMHNEVDIEYRLATSYAYIKNWRMARLHFDRAIQIQPKAWWAYAGYAYALITSSRDNRHEAESLAMKADELAIKMGISKVERARIKTTFGKIREKEGDTKMAETYYLESIDDNPGHVAGYGLLANLYIKQNRPQEASDIIKKGLITNPRNQKLIKISSKLTASEEIDLDEETTSEFDEK